MCIRARISRAPYFREEVRKMFVRNQWYVASWDHEIDRLPLARTICGEAIMIYRRFDRSVVALYDACPHRLLPLSMGVTARLAIWITMESWRLKSIDLLNPCGRNKRCKFTPSKWRQCFVY